jgi:hypothetical protein
MSTNIDAFVAQCWADHASQPDAVASRLRTDTPAPTQPAHLAALARLVVHVLGEHLGRFDDARWRLGALRDHALADASVQSALRVAFATLDLAEHDATTVPGLDLAERVRSEAAAAALCVGRGQSGRALRLLATARERVAALPHASAADHRPLAVACNNMAWELHARGRQRSADDTAAMLDIAAASRAHWALTGTWLEVERADYCLALTHLDAGQADTALHHAAQCLAACLTHDAPPYEHFFGHEAMARVQAARGDRAAARHHADAACAAFARLPVHEQADCRAARDGVAAFAAA